MKKPVVKTNGRKKDLDPKLGTARTALYTIVLLLWVGTMTYGIQNIVFRIMALVLKESGISYSFFEDICTVLSDLLALIVIILVPRWIKILMSDEPKEKRKISCKEWFIKFGESVGLKSLPTWTDIGLALVGFPVYILLAALFTNILSIFPWFNTNEAQDLGLSPFMSKPELLVTFFTLAVFVPIVEEIIYRGFLYGELREKTAVKTSNTISIIISVLLTSVLFGIMHMQWNVGVDVFALSIVLCLLREITGTIHSGILLHMLKNGIAFYLVYVLGIGLL